ncbi:hypothetical protein K431DRAFT_231593 [Polychaeton citri CBS 116435]|uniref:LDB19 N-terminal domain-containing protein n=1 Tax=Polychaeton citri CBS 116435 TaxID=1314669 RepID=A0A9P4Q1M1_9PEZI|nr:hypothetical protein K431DRAFT_231593 [Polychaeton citri CBS 116435]
MPLKPVKLNMFMESPPAMFIESPASSSGALISGRVQVTPNYSSVTITSIAMFLEATVSTKRPVADRCRECASQINDLFEWKFLSQPKVYESSKGMQELPFSHLIPGHLPVTTHGHMGSIDYSLHVRAMSADGIETEFRRPLPVLRALRPGNDKNSVRIFPPTNLTLHVTLPSIIHPIGEFPVTCRMTGIVTKREDTQTRWRLRKLSWRVEEHETMVSPACGKHQDKVGGEGKGVKHENSRDIGSEELKSGWKTDFSDGQIDGEFMAAIDTSTNPQCDVESPNGLKISHNLVVELVIAEEWATNRKPDQGTPTGAARVLRTQFNLNLTERAGLGIAWDDEMPPVYEDVPASPPHYPVDLAAAAAASSSSSTTGATASGSVASDEQRRGSSGGNTTMEDYDGDDLHEDVEDLHLSS